MLNYQFFINLFGNSYDIILIILDNMKHFTTTLSTQTVDVTP